MNWYTSDRKERLPKNWAHLIALVKHRDKNRCTAQTHAPQCDGRGTEVDHIIPGDNHSPDNLQLLSHACHKQKTIEETKARNRRNAALRRCPQEPHPGRIRT